MPTKAIAREVAESVARVLTDEALGDRLARLSTDVSRFTGTERAALLAEAGRRLAARRSAAEAAVKAVRFAARLSTDAAYDSGSPELDATWDAVRACLVALGLDADTIIEAGA